MNGHPEAKDRAVLDREHVRLLSIGYYVLGTLGALFACIPLIHVTIGSFLMLGPGTWARGDDAAAAFTIGALFAIVGSAVVLLGWLFAGLKIYAGYCLARRKNRVFCLVVAAISCISIPYGTILGVFTLIVLTRPSVIELFEGSAGRLGTPAGTESS